MKHQADYFEVLTHFQRLIRGRYVMISQYSIIKYDILLYVIINLKRLLWNLGSRFFGLSQ